MAPPHPRSEAETSTAVPQSVQQAITENHAVLCKTKPQNLYSTIQYTGVPLGALLYRINLMAYERHFSKTRYALRKVPVLN
jgi:hypothetical protein